MQVVVLVGGKGTRLGTITGSTPKPLLPVGGRPFLDYLMQSVLAQGADDILLLAGHFGEQLKDFSDRWNRICGGRLRCMIEPEPAGTGGALRQVASYLSEQFYLLNGDSLFDVKLADVANIAAPQTWVAKIALRKVADGARYGSVMVDGTHIVKFTEKHASGPVLINGGVYFLRKTVLSYLHVVPCSLEADVFPVLSRDGHLFGQAFPSFFIDIGIPADFERAQTAVPRQAALRIDQGYTRQVD